MPPLALALFAHPDDEVLACGGTLVSLLARGWEVRVVFVGDGLVTARSERQDNRTDASVAGDALGSGEPTFVGVEDQRFDTRSVSDVINATREAVSGRPDLVLTHADTDLNDDHRVVSHVARVLSRPIEGPRALVECEVPASGAWNGRPFQPNWYVDVSDHLERKLAALACYKNEARTFPHPCSPEAVTALARAHGAASGLAAAEAMRVVRGYHGLLP
jgi:LmbE family N-acetylglucosaminyl deacetylase